MVFTIDGKRYRLKDWVTITLAVIFVLLFYIGLMTWAYLYLVAAFNEGSHVTNNYEIYKALNHFDAKAESVKHVEPLEIDDVTSKTSYDMNNDDFDLICAIVRQEAGPDYTSALAVMSTVNNRLNDERWSWCGDTVLEQFTHPGQFCYSIDDLWIRYLDGNVEDCVKQAVRDGLNGVTNHDYNCFRGYPVEDGELIGLDNWYFESY